MLLRSQPRVASALGIRSGATPRGPRQPNTSSSADPQKGDISIWQRTGHCYLALTCGYPRSGVEPSPRASPSGSVQTSCLGLLSIRLVSRAEPRPAKLCSRVKSARPPYLRGPRVMIVRALHNPAVNSRVQPRQLLDHRLRAP